MIEQCMQMMGRTMMGGMMGGMMGPMILGGLLLTAALIIALVLLVRYSRNRTPPGRTAALSILEERFAPGQLDREEFEERRSILLSGR